MLGLVGGVQSASADNVYQDTLAGLDEHIKAIENLTDRLEEVSSWNMDAYRYRIDERILELVTMLVPAAALLEDPSLDDAAAAEFKGILLHYMEKALDLALMRVAQIGDRIAEAREEIDEFEGGVNSAVAESFAQEQHRVRMRYLDALINYLETLERVEQRVEDPSLLVLKSSQLRVMIDEALILLVERIMGQIQLDDLTLSELRRQVAEDPLDDNLARAHRAVQRKQARNLANLEGSLEFLDRLGMSSASYRALLIRMRGTIGVELLEWQVFQAIMSQNWGRLKRALVANGPNFLFRLVLFLLVVIIAWVLARLVRSLVGYVLGMERVKITDLSRDVLISVTGIGTFLVGLVVALATLGLSVTPLLAGMGVAGLILGLALQDSLGNLASGAMILLYQPYDVDDHIQVAGVEGIVKRMNLVATTVTTFDNQVLVVPNNKIWGDTIVNHTASRARRVDVEVSFSYDEDIDFVEQLLLEEMRSFEGVLSTPAPTVHIGRWDDSAVTMMAKPWVRTPQYWTVLRGLTKRFKQRFDQEGIKIPYPQRDVHLFEHGKPEKPPERKSAGPPACGTDADQPPDAHGED